MATSHDSVVVPEVNYYDCGDFVFIFGPLFSFKQKIGPRPIRPLLLVQVRRRPDGGGEGLVLVHYFFVYCSVSSAILKLFITGKLGDEYWKGVSTLTSTSLYPPINEVGLRVFTRLLATQSEHPVIVDVVGILACLHRYMPQALPLPSTGERMQHFIIHDVSGFLRIPLPLINQDVNVFPISLFTTFHFEDKKQHKMLRVPDSFRSFLYSLAMNKSTDNLLLSVRCVGGELVIEEPLNLPPVLACALSLSTPLKYRTHSIFWLDESEFRTSKLRELSDKVVVQRPFPDTLMLGRFSITDMISRHINTMDPIQQSKVWNEYLEYYTWRLSIRSEENVEEFCRLLMSNEKDIGEKRPQQAKETPITLFTSSIMKEDTESDKTARVQNAQRADEVAKLAAVKDDGFEFQLDHPQLSELRKFDVTVGDEIFNILKGDKPEEMMRLHVLASCDLTLLHKSDGSRLKIWFYVIDRSGGPVAYPHYVSIETGPALQVTTCGTGLRNPSYLLETTALIQQLAASGRYVDNYDAWAAAAANELSTISGMIVAEYKSKFPDDGGGGGGAAKGGGSAFKIRSFKNHKHNKTYKNKSRNRHIINKHKKHSRNKHKKHTRRKSNRK